MDEVHSKPLAIGNWNCSQCHGTAVDWGYLAHCAKGAVRQSLIYLLLLGTLLRFFTAPDPFLHEWDERYHALVAKNMVEQPWRPTLYADPILPYDYRDWSQNHVWLHKQPVPLWTMALAIKWGGANEWTVRLPSLLLSLLAVLFTFGIGRQLFCPRIGLLAAFFHAIHGLCLEIGSGRVATDHIDLHFMVWIELAVLLAIYQARQRRYWSLIGMTVCVGLAILSKWLPALIVLPLWGLLRWEREGGRRASLLLDAALVVGLLLLIIVPWQWYIHTYFPQEAAWERAYDLRHIFEPLQGQGGPFYYHFNQIRIVYGELVYLVLGAVAWRCWWRPQVRYGVLALWIVVPLLFFSAVQTKMQGYLLFTAPAFFLLTAWMIYGLSRLRSTAARPYLWSLLIACLYLLPLRYSVERVKPFRPAVAPEWVVPLKDFTARLNDTERHVLFGEPHPIEAMFYGSSLTAYPQAGDPPLVRRLREAGYRVWMRQELEGRVVYTAW